MNVNCSSGVQQQGPPPERTRRAPVRVLPNIPPPPYCCEPLRQLWLLAQPGWDSGEVCRTTAGLKRGGARSRCLSVSANPKFDVLRQ